MSKIVLVTGASSGIGLAICRKLSQQGHTVYGGSRSLGNGTKTNGVVHLAMDVRHPLEVESAIAEIMQRSGRLDVVVNCAGYELLGSAETTSDAELRALFDTNFFGMTHVCKQALPLLRESNGGYIINLVSRDVRLGMPYRSGYSAATAAVLAYSEALSLEVGPDRIHIILLELGPFATSLHDHAVVAEHTSSTDGLNAVHRVEAQLGKRSSRAMSPEAIGHLVATIILHPKPKLYYRTHQLRQMWSSFLRTFLPSRRFEQYIRWTYTLPNSNKKKSDD